MNSRMMDDIESATKTTNNPEASGEMTKIIKLMGFGYKISFENNSFKISKRDILHNQYLDSIREPLNPNKSIQKEWNPNSIPQWTCDVSSARHFQLNNDDMFFYNPISEFNSTADKIIKRETKKREEDKQKEIESIVKQIKDMEDRLEDLKSKLECTK